MNLSSKQSVIILLVLAISLTFLFWGKIILHPNSYLFGPGGDGVKNYYTLIYYLKYDSGLHFSGMNYPYGEHITFTGGQPIVAVLLKWFNSNLIDTTENTIGLINLIMIFSVIPCILFLYLILRHHLLPQWYSILISLILGFLSPQFDRFTGHYGLSYMFFVPMVWYLIIRVEQAKNPTFLNLLLVIVLIVFGFIHPYYVIIGSTFIIGYFLVYFLQERKQFNRPKLLLGFLVAIIPLIFMKFFLYFTDTVADRHPSPWGFFTAGASFESVFLPVYGPFLDVWNYFIDVRKANWEGHAYVGFVGLLVLIFILIKVIRYITKKNYRYIFRPVLPGHLRIALWASILILLLSMVYPFKLGMDFLLDWIPPLKQFRSIGRLAWVFYYVFTVFSATYCYLVFRRLRVRASINIAAIFVSLLIISWALDAVVNVTYKRDYILKNKIASDFLDNSYSNWINESNSSVKEFQAILALPYFNMGSEELYIFRSGHALFEALRASYDTGIPIASVFMSRTSISQSFRQAQLISSNNIEKTILNDYSSRKPLMLITTKEALNADESAIVKKAELIFTNDHIALYKLPLAALRANWEVIRQSFQVKKNSLFRGKNYLSTGESEGLIINNYDDKKTPFSLFGQGSLYKKKGKLEIVKTSIPVRSDSIMMHLSLWVRSDTRRAAFPVLHYEQYDPNGTLIEHVEINPKYLTEVYRDWIQIKRSFILYDKNNKVEIYMEGDDIHIDEVMIRPADVDVFTHIGEDGSFVMNNYFIPSSGKASIN